MTRGIAPLSMIGLLLLGSGNILLLAFAATEILQEDDVPEVRSRDWNPKLSTATERLTGATPLSAYQQTTARPVFFKTRQPFVPPRPPSPPAPLAARSTPSPPPVVDPGLAIGGIIITSETKKAYLFRKADRSGSWLSEGEEIMGWRVQSIDSGGAKLKKDSHDIELPLYAQP